MATPTNSSAPLRTTTELGTWTASLTGSDTGYDDDGAQWTMQTRLVTMPTGTETDAGHTTLGIFATNTADAAQRLRSLAW